MHIRNIILGTLILAFSFGSYAADKIINISSEASYYDEKIIPSKITSECTQLGGQFSQATKKYLEANGWSVNLADEVNESSKGTSIKLQITNALSSGNAFIGHRKSVSVLAELYKDGKLIDSYTTSRDSSGGFGGGFKGSCAVLQRCVNTLGSDVSKWVKKQDI